MGTPRICEALLEAGAEADIQNDSEESVFDSILPRKRDQIIAVLTRYGRGGPAQPDEKP